MNRSDSFRPTASSRGRGPKSCESNDVELPVSSKRSAAVDLKYGLPVYGLLSLEKRSKAKPEGAQLTFPQRVLPVGVEGKLSMDSARQLLHQ